MAGVAASHCWLSAIGARAGVARAGLPVMAPDVFAGGARAAATASEGSTIKGVGANPAGPRSFVAFAT
ncbi:hypothetical protein [Enorma phocaeensis]|uniref:hypothetical protein n=1 Tax=Enorma phocaeensis TaxID=1871019 RepID=UPI0019565222|nr:hypothetical protein [Enorma phocaeensis]MBM6953587.1 hypothetical protein [Enorma phocaeensis]